jgi:hypothetical protein
VSDTAGHRASEIAVYPLEHVHGFVLRTPGREVSGSGDFCAY